MPESYIHERCTFQWYSKGTSVKDFHIPPNATVFQNTGSSQGPLNQEQQHGLWTPGPFS